MLLKSQIGRLKDTGKGHLGRTAHPDSIRMLYSCRVLRVWMILGRSSQSPRLDLRDLSNILQCYVECLISLGHCMQRFGNELGSLKSSHQNFKQYWRKIQGLGSVFWLDTKPGCLEGLLGKRREDSLQQTVIPNIDLDSSEMTGQLELQSIPQGFRELFLCESWLAENSFWFCLVL